MFRPSPAYRVLSQLVLTCCEVWDDADGQKMNYSRKDHHIGKRFLGDSDIGRYAVKEVRAEPHASVKQWNIGPQTTGGCSWLGERLTDKL